jgi:hypothetical protein
MILQNAYPSSSSARSQIRSDRALESRDSNSSDCLVPVRLSLGSVGFQREEDERTRYTRKALSLPVVAMQLHRKFYRNNQQDATV